MIKFSLACLLLSQLAPLYSQGAKWRPVEATTFHWTENTRPYTFIVEQPAADRSEDAPRLRIKGPAGRGFALVLPGGLDKIQDKKLTADNLIKSSYLYLTPKLKDAQGRPMLVVFGWAHGSNPGSLGVLALDKTGHPTSVFRSGTFEIAALQDIDGDGLSEIIGVHCLSQLWGTCFSTYDPYSVYHLPVSGEGKATLSLELSKQYNLKHYYGWAGPRCREDVAVVLCAPKGKPRVMSAKEAERLYRK